MTEPNKEKPTITVSGVTFSADDVKTATIEIGGREVIIGAKPDENKAIGFKRKTVE